MAKPDRRLSTFLLLALLAWSGPARAGDLADLVRSWGPVISTTGNEQALAGRVAAALPAALKIERDPFGSLFVRSGNAAPGLAVFAAQTEDAGHVTTVLVAGNGEHDLFRARLQDVLALPVRSFDPFTAEETGVPPENRGAWGAAALR